MIRPPAAALRIAPLRHAATLSRVERKKRDKLDRIKRAARTLFARKGFEATTTREIAAAADVGAGTVFLHAGSKQDLLVMIFREEAGRAVDAAFQTMTERRLIDQLLRIFGALIAHHERNLGLARVFVKELPFIDDRRHGAASFMTDLFKRMAALIDRAQQRGELRSGFQSFLLAQNLFALYFACLHRWLGAAGQTADERDRALRASLELHLSGLRR
ncbi:MAG TPA: helix-turn-helix domain-containing protein [Candidatus Binataceae bacterium]|nr:helix-turn-helix domain-containing protein [Candidatus Binataceae bacterium]